MINHPNRGRIPADTNLHIFVSYVGGSSGAIVVTPETLDKLVELSGYPRVSKTKWRDGTKNYIEVLGTTDKAPAHSTMPDAIAKLGYYCLRAKHARKRDGGYNFTMPSEIMTGRRVEIFPRDIMHPSGVVKSIETGAIHQDETVARIVWDNGVESDHRLVDLVLL